MNNITIGLIGYGVVGSGVAEFLKKQKSILKKRFNVNFQLKTVCDLYIDQRDPKYLKDVICTKNYQDILQDESIDVVIELIGGINPAKDIAITALTNGKHVITANKALISNCGKELFELAQKQQRHLFFESAVGAGVPIIKTITEGIVGNSFDGLYGIVNGTCNFILDVMSKKGLTFDEAVKEAQALGYAEADPTLDVNGMDTAHKLSIMIYLALKKFINVKEIYTEGITDISKEDIENAEDMGLTIKLLAIAKKNKNEIEARVHPTLISKDHPLASINGVLNAVYLNANPLGDILLSGEGAGKMAAASGVISDLINLSTKTINRLNCNLFDEEEGLELKAFDNISTKFYIRFMALDNPGVLSQIAGILGNHNIGINSVSQKAHSGKTAVPVIILTDVTTEKDLRLALKEIQKLSIVKAKPIAIRMEKLQ